MACFRWYVGSGLIFQELFAVLETDAGNPVSLGVRQLEGNRWG